MSEAQQPVYVLPEGSRRTIGRPAQRNNILAAKILAETIKTTLGPKGMDKMLVDSMGDVIVTNDGVTILQEMQLEHPIAKMIVEIAKTQEDEVGDGTTTAVVFAGELLKNAEELIEKNIHPTIIIKGYRLAAEKSQIILENMAEHISVKDLSLLKNIAMTSMTGKGAEVAREYLADLIVKSIISVYDLETKSVDKDFIKIEKKTGNGIENSSLINGVLLDKETVHPGMPKFIKNARIALLDLPLELKNTEIDAKISLTSPEQLQAFIDKEEQMLKSMVDKVINSGANVVICQKGIDDVAQHYLAKSGVYALRRVKASDLEKLSKATGGKVVNNLNDLSSEDLGKAGLVESKKVGDEEMTFVNGCKNPKSVTLLIRGGTSHVINEIERAVEDALGALVSALEDEKVVAGAGAPEMELARQLRKFANTLSGREQLAVLAFADAMEIIPKSLAENAGLDSIDVLVKLKAEHDKGNKWSGLDVFTGKVVDAWKNSVIEPLRIKSQAIKSASEVSELILRIDDVIASGKREQPQMPPQDMM